MLKETETGKVGFWRLWPVSEVDLRAANPFEIREDLAAGATALRVRMGKLADGVEFKLTLRLQAGRFSLLRLRAPVEKNGRAGESAKKHSRRLSEYDQPIREELTEAVDCDNRPLESLKNPGTSKLWVAGSSPAGRAKSVDYILMFPNSSAQP